MREKQLVFPVQEIVQHYVSTDYSQHITVTEGLKTYVNKSPEFSLCGVRIKR